MAAMFCLFLTTEKYGIQQQLVSNASPYLVTFLDVVVLVMCCSFPLSLTSAGEFCSFHILTPNEHVYQWSLLMSAMFSLVLTNGNAWNITGSE